MEDVDSEGHLATYLGDGVYAIFDGSGIWLRTGDHREKLADNKIYLEPEVLQALESFKKLAYKETT